MLLFSSEPMVIQIRRRRTSPLPPPCASYNVGKLTTMGFAFCVIFSGGIDVLGIALLVLLTYLYLSSFSSPSGGVEGRFKLHPIDRRINHDLERDKLANRLMEKLLKRTGNQELGMCTAIHNEGRFITEWLIFVCPPPFLPLLR